MIARCAVYIPSAQAIVRLADDERRRDRDGPRRRLRAVGVAQHDGVIAGGEQQRAASA